MFLFVVWIVVYAPLIWRTVNVMPIFAASAWMIGIIRLSSARVSAIISTFLHAEAVHLPVPPEYFDCFISAAALVDVAGLVRRRVRVVLREPVVVHHGRRDVRRDRADHGAAPGLPERLLVDDQFIALRTWMSSNGGCVRFIVRYQVRSPTFGSSCGFRFGSGHVLADRLRLRARLLVLELARLAPSRRCRPRSS